MKRELEERIAIKIEKSRAEEVRRKLTYLGVMDNDFKPKMEGDYIFFPLKTMRGLDVLLKNCSAEIVRTFFERRWRKPRNLREVLQNILPEELHRHIPSSIDLVGDVALIQIPKELEDYSREIGRAVMEIYPRVKTVLSKQGGTVGEYRIRMFKIINGGPDTETIHREHRCIYELDLMKAFFNPRMSGERLRIAHQVRDGENILDMFAGVGPFSILIAKKNPTVKIIATEVNPEAYKYFLKNILLNKVGDRVKAIQGDVREVLKNININFDRIIMDLPYNSLEFLDLALNKLKENGVVHVYHVEGGVDSINKASIKVSKLAEKFGYKIVVAYSRQVLEVAPLKFIIALDLIKTS